MRIDRSNYEIWLIDWLDGNLSDFQIEQLQHFLSENSDLKEEFDELAAFKLNPFVKSFPHKTSLKKTNSELSGSQFDYLCVTYLENDLSTSQQTELKESIEQDPERKRSFELIQKMRLSPVTFPYKQKNRLIKRTVVQKVIRLSFIGLSAAAIIALAVITYILIPRTPPDKIKNTAQNIVVDSTIQKPPVEIVPDKITTEKKVVNIHKQNGNLFAVVQKNNSEIPESNMNIPFPNDSLVRNRDNPGILLNKIPVPEKILLKADAVTNNLIVLNFIVTIPAYDDGRSKLSKFIAKTFREKILKENTTKDSPLKAYEIAEAGVAGLNRLLGWEMALDKKNDENGELKSVYFSSKILKFNAPVKKSEPLP